MISTEVGLLVVVSIECDWYINGVGLGGITSEEYGTNLRSTEFYCIKTSNGNYNLILPLSIMFAGIR